LVIPVDICPELQAFRKAEMRKPTAILGPHISIPGQFEPGDLTDSVVSRVSQATRSFPAISCTFSQFGVFPDASVVYLSPYPVGPFETLRDLILKELTWHRPAFKHPIFHLSLACGFELASLPDLMGRAHEQLDPLLPLTADLRELILTDRIGGVWETRRSFRLWS